MKLPNLSEILEYYPEFKGVHPAAELFPLPTEKEFEALVKDIKDHGLMHDLLRDSKTGQLIDGRSRLMACYESRSEIRVVDYYADPFVASISANMTRRHLTVGQKAVIGDTIRDHYDVEAKERQVDSGKEYGRGGTKGSGNITTSFNGRSRDKVAGIVGVGGSAIDKIRKIRENAPEEYEKVAAGEMSLEAGYKAAKKNIAALPSADVEKPGPVVPESFVSIVTVEGSSMEVPEPRKVVFNKTNDSVSWAGYTWNPVTGCKHGCSFCYAEGISKQAKMRDSYPFGFAPTFHEYRLAAPRNTKPDGRVFVCSMADLFGKWVPDEWISKVFSACMEAPEWEYLFLTKWPRRYSMISTLPKAWFGATIIKQVDVARVEKDMKSFATNGIKWVSLEPMLEPIRFDDLSWCNLVVIGSQTAANGQPAFSPQFDWVVDVVLQCREAGVPYYLKHNLMEDEPGMIMPRNLPSVFDNLPSSFM